MKRNLLVTLADQNYINQAKQLFSSVYFNAGWEGDYMLFAHEIPEEELKWFTDKGILIKKCASLLTEAEIGNRPVTVLSKFYLFTPEFKKWQNIVYLDADIIVRASLNELTNIRGLAVHRCDNFGRQFVKPRSMLLDTESWKINMKLFDELKRNYDLREEGLNSGVMAFSSDIIEEDTFAKLKRLSELYGKISKYGEQPILNLFFYKKFTLLPSGFVYNFLDINYMLRSCNIEPDKIMGIILHFNSPSKPWLPKIPFYKEWETNLSRADLIDLKKVLPPRESWTGEEIAKYFLYLRKRFNLHFHRHIFWRISCFVDKILELIDTNLGLAGIFLKKHYPKLYFRLRKIKQRWNENGKSKSFNNNPGL
jgi:lipopolysaccharide biosynthesis glycosyltransferase